MMLIWLHCLRKTTHSLESPTLCLSSHQNLTLCSDVLLHPSPLPFIQPSIFILLHILSSHLYSPSRLSSLTFIISHIYIPISFVTIQPQYLHLAFSFLYMCFVHSHSLSILLNNISNIKQPTFLCLLSDKSTTRVQIQSVQTRAIPKILSIKHIQIR